MTQAKIIIQRGIPADHMRRAAEIYHEAFQQKLQHILGTPEEAIPILEAAMQSDNAFVALLDGVVVGIVGFHYGDQQLLDVKYSALVEKFGILRGSWRAILGLLLSRSPEPGELLLDGIAVHADARGQGVGTRLFDAIFAFAKEANFTRIRLDVVNSNPRARQLYERLGFIATKTEHVPFMQSFGFTASTTMQKSIP